MKQCRIAITTKCNLKCPYCCMQQPEVLATFETIYCLYDFSIYKAHTFSYKLDEYDTIMITGGEPLLDFYKLESYMRDILRRVSRNTKIYLYTNGTLLNSSDYMLNKLKRWFNGINVSIHDPKTFKFKRLLKSVHEVIPVRIHIYEKLITDDFINWCNRYDIKYKAWKMNECHVDEDRYIIK